MAELPTTRRSLLCRVKDPRDADAWQEFVQIYRPAIYRFARKRGLQPADADDLAQLVFAKVSEKVQDWDFEEKGGSFRAWILVVTRNAVINSLTRRKPDIASGGTTMTQQLANYKIQQEQVDAELQHEYRRATFRHAAKIVRAEFTETTWQAFWLTSTENLATEVVVDQLGITMGALYAARSRVMRRLKEVVKQLVEEDET